MTIPATGILGEAALREAAASSYQDIIQRVTAAVRALFKQTGRENYVYLRGLWPEQAVVSVSESGGDARLLSYPYTLAERGAVTLGSPVEVVETFTPADASMREAAGALLEAAPDAATTDAGTGAVNARYRVRVIRAGLSGNGNYYPDATLREARGLFDGARVFVKSDAEHLKGGGKDLRNLVGRLSDVVFVEGKAADTGELRAVLTLIDPSEAVSVKLREAVKGGMADLFGLSIDAGGRVKAGKVGGRALKVATAITTVKSVDLIVEPGAGGAVMSLIEALDEEAMLRARLIDTINRRRPALLAGKDVAALSDDELEAVFAEAMGDPAMSGGPGDPAPVPKSDPKPAPAGATDPGEVARLVEAQVTARLNRNVAMRERVGRSALPDRAKARLTAEFEGQAEFREADVERRIQDEIAYLAPAATGDRVRGLGEDSLILFGETRADKLREAMAAFWDPSHKHHRDAPSLKDLYVMATGDRRVTGRTRDCDEALLREALDGEDFAAVFLDSMNKRVIQSYREYRELDGWRDLTGEPVPIGDFREQSRVAWGGYGDLPIVAKNDPYVELESPSEDDPATYKVHKRGRLESIAVEDIKNDDVGFVRRIPVDLGRAAKRTLYKFVLNFLRDNPVIKDGKTLFHADHGNLITSALGAASYKALRLMMKRQRDIGGNDTIGVNPRFLWVPDALEETAFDLFTLAQRNDPDFTVTLKPAIRPVFHWTDEADWCVSADPRDIPTIEIGFLDGKDEPELWTQDSPTSGSLFTNDQITWKVRHIYGGTVLDHRGLGKSVVA
ncbi:hypothetical protein HL658_31345 [Azospirillum sp. RWY-5-1]|uniref:Bacteriophage Mu GpT domain-containing protein n=1 Tax=Azospirillum oleiclasticum TaxID=2735135 RepID=A0ABX2TJH2_9PROT|nr:hypothetical protein [Azospirillum oleiclasticum]NYZ17061.1 hypothetical protein [Azospirillum oleiclasticum]NYZ24495.1 hypothetical protein [Azospirillum oleiclasticum]